MKRISLLSLTISCLISGAYAAPISSADALVVAKDFLSERGINASSIHNVTSCTRAETTISDAHDEAYYLFNIGDADGFIIVAADGRPSPVLGYSLEGNINPENMPEACAAWLDATASYNSNDIPLAKKNVYPDFTVQPLLKCRWDQKDPYNRQCPIDKTSGLRSATGCVATAAAQVMHYYQYPSQPVGKVEYEDKRQGEMRSFDFSAMTPIDWANISDTYSSESSEKECNAIAALMNAVSHGARMQFSSKTSLAYNYNAGLAMIDFFGYDPDMHYYERALVSDEEWISIITSELKAGRPILYEGANATMGHAFVCDGYDGKGFFHINWGWNGLSDGYFSISALNPKNQSTGGSDNGYSLRQTILCNIAPKGSAELQPQKIGLLNIDKLYFRDSSNFHYAADIESLSSPTADAMLFFYSFNKGLKPFSGEVCAAMVNDNDISPISALEIESIGSQNYTAIRLPLSNISLPDGIYTIGFYYRSSHSDTWHPISASNSGAPSQCLLVVSGSEVTMSAVYPEITIEMTDNFSHSRLYSNSDASFNFDLSNSGTTRLEAYAGVAVLDSDGNYLSSYSLPIICPAQDKVPVEINANLKGLSAGEYLLLPFYSYNNNPVAADIYPLASQPFHAVVGCVVLSPTSGNFFLIDSENPLLNISVSNLLPLDWSAQVAVEIISPDGSSAGYLKGSEMTLGPSATSSFGFDCSGLTLAKGSYKVRFFIDEEKPILLAEFSMMALTDMASVSTVYAHDIEISITDSICISSNDSIISCTLYDTAGHLLADLRPHSSEAIIHADKLSAGIYILSVATESGKTVTKKLKL